MFEESPTSLQGITNILTLDSFKVLLIAYDGNDYFFKRHLKDYSTVF